MDLYILDNTCLSPITTLSRGYFQKYIWFPNISKQFPGDSHLLEIDVVVNSNYKEVLLKWGRAEMLRVPEQCV